ncbi:MAG: hypothetical protein MZU97_11960 [Bacillus subtilis]|nr:hypothetical protein [Bacillus subtilis]
MTSGPWEASIPRASPSPPSGTPSAAGPTCPAAPGSAWTSRTWEAAATTYSSRVGRGRSGTSFWNLTYGGISAAADLVGRTTSPELGDLVRFTWAPVEWDQAAGFPDRCGSSCPWPCPDRTLTDGGEAGHPPADRGVRQPGEPHRLLRFPWGRRPALPDLPLLPGEGAGPGNPGAGPVPSRGLPGHGPARSRGGEASADRRRRRRVRGTLRGPRLGRTPGVLGAPGPGRGAGLRRALAALALVLYATAPTGLSRGPPRCWRA